MKLGFLRRLYDNYGDYTSVYMNASRAAEDGAHAVELRWRSVRERLEADGADRPTLDAVQDVVTDPANAAAGLAVFGCHGTVAMHARLRTAPRHQIARFAALPHVMPMLAQRPPRVPHVRATAKRAGGGILAVTGTGRILEKWRVRSGWPLHKSSEGRTSNQHGPEAEWEANAREVAANMTSATAEVHAEHIILAGDPRARSAVLNHLNPKLRDMTVVVDAEVPADSVALAEAADNLTTQASERTSVSRYGTWHSLAADNAAVAGLSSTVEALADGRAADVFIADDPSSDASLWTGSGGAQLAMTADALAERGVAQAVRDRADAAIARAVACTDADLFFLPDDAEPPAEGIGATLRY
jgi:hypothetical protein